MYGLTFSGYVSVLMFRNVQAASKMQSFFPPS